MNVPLNGGSVHGLVVGARGGDAAADKQALPVVSVEPHRVVPGFPVVVLQ